MILIDWLLFIPLAFCVAYLLIYGIASKFYITPHFPEAQKNKRFAVLFPAYKEDQVIVSSVSSFMKQDYPQEKFDIFVISDQMQPTTNDELRALPIRLLLANYKNSSKARALALAMDTIKEEEYDIVVIMDADNLTVPFFLTELNQAFENGIHAVQARRTGKKTYSDISLLDSVSEEINNGFFRSGHNALGLSAALSGSGMAFDFNWFQQNVKKLHTAGEDKELEALLLQQRIHITYLKQLPVYDEKIEKKEAIKNQRKRWIAAQYGALHSSIPNFPKALLKGNWDYCNKIIQWMLPPRLIQLAAVFGFTFIFTLIGILINIQHEENMWLFVIKWWILSFAQFAAMILPIPKKMFNKQLGKAIIQIPSLTIDMISNLFKLRGVNKKFIHTEHGENKKESDFF